MPNVYRFSASNFSGLGLEHGASWVSKLAPSCSFWPQDFSSAAHLSLLELDVFQKWRLGKALGSILVAPDLDLREFGDDFCEIFDTLRSNCAAKNNLKHLLTQSLGFTASGLRSASAGRAKRKQFLTSKSYLF